MSTKPVISQFSQIASLMVQEYERYLPTAFDESMTLLEKVNKIIQKLSEIGLATNSLITQWNEVMEWVMSDGLTESVQDKLDEMATDGTLEQLINVDILNSKADGSVFRFTEGTTGSEKAVNTVIGFEGNAVAGETRGSHVQQGSLLNENIVGGNTSTVGLAQSNVVDPTKTTAHYSFLGGYDNVSNALAGIILAYHCYLEEQATHGNIVGGSYHKITDGDYASIIGGTKGFIEYLNGGSYSGILGGSDSNVFAKFSGMIASLQSRIGTQLANKEFSSIISSNLSTVDGNYASIVSGNECKATKDYSRASGKYAVANNVGERVHSTGKHATVGDSLSSQLHLLRTTTDGIATQLTTDDQNTAIAVVGSNTVIGLTGIVSGIRTDTAGSCSFEVKAQVSNVGGTLVVNGLTVTPIYSSDPAYTVDVVAVGSSYQIRAKGVAGHTIKWTGSFNLAITRNI